MPSNIGFVGETPDRPSPEWKWVGSSFIMGIRFIGKDWLDVRFHPSGFTARYFGVAPSLYWAFLAAPSKGKYWHAHFKKWADWTEITDR